MGSVSTPSTTCALSFLGFLDCSAGSADSDDAAGKTLVTTIGISFLSFGAQLLGFALLRLRLTRIYQPRTYLVPERERTATPPGGVIGWMIPIFTTPNITILQRCGLDAYFFLRYLRMLLKIFFPLAVLFLPILMPINATAGGTAVGLDILSISNMGKSSTLYARMWAYLVLAIVAIAWVFYIAFQELRGYVRVRQAFLTSPQHRIRASATTVLVTSIPRKWLTYDALSGLYDIFPGGIKNIWINRNYDQLAQKVANRRKIAKSLEGAETSLIQVCRKKHVENEEKKAGKDKEKPKKTKAERKQDDVDEDAAAEAMAQGQGTSTGDRQETRPGTEAAFEVHDEGRGNGEKRAKNPLAVVTGGFGALGREVGKLSGKVVGGVDSGLRKTGENFNNATELANTGGLTGGFALDESLYRYSSAPPTPPPRPEAVAVAAMQSNPVSEKRAVLVAPVNSIDGQGSPSSERTLGGLDVSITRPSHDSKPKSHFEIEEPGTHKSNKLWRLFGNNDAALALPSPQPHVADEEEFPLRVEPVAEEAVSKSKWTEKLAFWKSSNVPPQEYPDACNPEFDADQDGEPVWRQYIEEKDRPTMRLPLFAGCPALPLVGKKVDKIHHLRRELARLNLEIEADQNDPDQYPLMNSAFIQFNHQVAAHMCCQSLNHHLPSQMAPRLVEISPNDVIWDNMSVKWWERYVRSGVVLAICASLVILYAIPVAFTTLLNKVSYIATLVPWLSWLTELPEWVIAAIQGILPPVLLSVILMLVPIIFRVLVKQQGVPTGKAKEEGVQVWYFTFLFIQVFLVVSLSSGLVEFLSTSLTDPKEIATTIATDFPEAATYFFSYLTVQALSQGASALLQTGTLFTWFILGPLLDSTARAKWRRQITLSKVNWGSFYPPFTNFAVIGLIYSVLAPLMLVFMILIFGIFWLVYRYNVLYVFQFKDDTGGLLFPVAINQLFVGIYFLELTLIGAFFTLENSDLDIVCIPQGVIMIVVLLLSFIFQWRLNVEFRPLQEYLPITLEDEAVLRDEAFAKAQDARFAPLRDGTEAADGTEDIEDALAQREKDERDEDEAMKEAERQQMESRRRSRTPGAESRLSPAQTPGTLDNRSKHSSSLPAIGLTWQHRGAGKPTWATDKWKKAAPEAVARLRYLADGTPVNAKAHGRQDVEGQRSVGDVLFSGFADELEDLSPGDRDLLVRYAFQHSALRARRPVVWIPRDRLGVSDDEIRRAQRMSTVEVDMNGNGKEEKTFIWMSNDGTALDSKGKVVFRRSPPDFSNVDLINL